jgi:dipeptidyl aminopeptidase/acylaminoacyl peptidase
MLTNHIGDRNKTVFNYISDLFFPKGKILLSAFNLKSKEFGFFELNENKNILLQLSMQPVYSGNLADIYTVPKVICAARSRTYMVSFESYNQAPNYFVTTDFKSFKQISNNQPQAQWNWLTAEIHHYKDSSGNILEGILYKPENFDREHKYPTVINFYFKKSDELNKFEGAILNGGDISVAHLVSSGYLVFKADIHPKIGRAGAAALESIISAADHLKKYEFIDSTKLAIAGHSFGGFEVNYILTHSTRFAAGISAAGVSDLVRNYTGTWGDGTSAQEYYKQSPQMMDTPLIEAKAKFIEGSPILFADKLQTPLLLMHNPEDGAVPFEESKSFFILLRSLKKRVWLISYKGENHTISNEENLFDYYHKIAGFLDHYLRGKPMPNWMNQYIGDKKCN